MRASGTLSRGCSSQSVNSNRWTRKRCRVDKTTVKWFSRHVSNVCLCRFIHLKHFNVNACLTLLMKSKIIQNIERRLGSERSHYLTQTSNFLRQNLFIEENFAQIEAFNFTILTCNKKWKCSNKHCFTPFGQLKYTKLSITMNLK